MIPIFFRVFIIVARHKHQSNNPIHASRIKPPRLVNSNAPRKPRYFGAKTISSVEGMIRHMGREIIANMNPIQDIMSFLFMSLQLHELISSFFFHIDDWVDCVCSA